MEKQAIYQLVFRKVKRKKYCERCGATNKKLIGHHHDYNKPLETETMCHKCHAIWHLNNKAIEPVKFKIILWTFKKII